MSTLRRKKAPYPKDAAGKNLCRCGCGQYPVPPRQTWYSDACVRKYKEANDPEYIRRMVFKRDKGICRECGLDTMEFWKRIKRGQWGMAPNHSDPRFRAGRSWRGEFLRDRYERAVRIWRRRAAQWRAAYSNRMVRLRAAGWNLERTTPYDVDHIIPVYAGGGQCSLANLQTLCHPHHKARTRQQAADRAAARRAAKIAVDTYEAPSCEEE